MQEPLHPKSGYRTYKRLLGYVKQYRFHFFVAVIGMVTFGLSQAKLASIIQVIIDDIFVAKDMFLLKEVLITLVIIGVARSTGGLISDYYICTFVKM